MRDSQSELAEDVMKNERPCWEQKNNSIMSRDGCWNAALQKKHGDGTLGTIKIGARMYEGSTNGPYSYHIATI